MQAEATAPTPPNSPARRASPTAAGDDAGAGRFGEALQAAQGREKALGNDQAPAEPEAKAAAPRPIVDSPPTREAVQPVLPTEATPPTGEPPTPQAGEGAAAPLQAMPPPPTAEAPPAAAEAPPAAAGPTLPVISPPIQPAPSPAVARTPGHATPTSMPATPITAMLPGTDTAPPSGHAVAEPQAAIQPTKGEAAPPAPAGQAGPGTPRPDRIPPEAPAQSSAAPTAPPIGGAAIGPAVAPTAPQPTGTPSPRAIEAATIGLATAGVQAAAAVPSTRPGKPPPPPPAETVATVQPAAPMDQPPPSPGIAAETSPAAPIAAIPAPAGIAVRVADGGETPTQAIDLTLETAAASPATSPGPTLPGIRGDASGLASAAPVPEAISAAPAMLPPPVANATTDRPVRPHRQTPAGQIVPVAIALSLGSEARSSITVSLDPIELGRVDVRVERMGDLASVQVVAERPETLQLLQRDQATLDRALADAGIGGGGRSLSFSLGGEGRGAQDRARRPMAAMPEITDSPAHVADQRGAGRPRALLDIAV